MKASWLLSICLLWMSAPSMASKNPYDVLGIRPSASENEIQLAYRRMRKRYHPDSNAGASPEELSELQRKFIEVQEAYAELTNGSSPNGARASEPFAPPPPPEEKQLTPQELDREIENVAKARSEAELLRSLERIDQSSAVLYQKRMGASEGSVAARNGYGSLDRLQRILPMAISSLESLSNDGALSIAAMLLNWDNAFTLRNDRSFSPANMVPAVKLLYRRLMQNGMSFDEMMNTLDHEGLVFPERPYGPNLFVDLAFEGKVINTANDFEDVVNAVKKHYRHIEPGYRPYIEDGKLYQVLPLISEMSAEGRLRLAYIVNRDPIDRLALMEAVFKAQRLDHKMSRDQLTDFITGNIRASLHYQGAYELEGYDRAKTPEYIAKHRGYDLESFEKLVAEAEADWEAKRKRAGVYYFGPTNIRKYVAANFFMKDLHTLLARYTGPNEVVWSKVAKALGTFRPVLMARIAKQMLDIPSWQSWTKIAKELAEENEAKEAGLLPTSPFAKACEKLFGRF